MRHLRLITALGVVFLGAIWGLPAEAQNVTEVQISPPKVEMRRGERTQVFAQANAANGNVVLGATFRWSSTDTNVVRVVADPQSSEIGTLEAIGPGAAVVQAIAGAGNGIRGFTTVTVAAPPQQQAQPQPPRQQQQIADVAPNVPDSVLSAPLASASLRAAARVEAQRFNSPSSCASGIVVGSGLVATSYQAIRGADRVIVALENGASFQDPQVVSYSVVNDLAILRVSGQTSDTVPLASGVRDDQFAWAVSYPACQAVASTSRVRISGTSPSLRHSGNMPESAVGSALIDHEGALIGIVNGDRTIAAPVNRIQSAVADARSNARPSTVADVGRAENHLFGGLVARSEVAGGTARVTALEAWQWAGVGREGPVPLSFTGPMGRYQVDLVVNGAVRASTTVRVAAGATQQVSLAPTPVLAQQPTQQPTQPAPSPQPPRPVAKKKGSAAVPVILLLAGGGGAAAYFLTKKKTDTVTPPVVSTGGVSVSIPNP